MRNILLIVITLVVIAVISILRTGRGSNTSLPDHLATLTSQRRLRQTGGSKIFAGYNDPRTVSVKKVGASPGPKKDFKASSAIDLKRPLVVCDRKAPIPHKLDIEITEKYSSCSLSKAPPEETKILLWEGIKTFGRTGNNLVEFLHGLQYARDNELLAGIVTGSWATHLITNMWMAVQDDPSNSRHSPERIGAMAEWTAFFERAFCVRILAEDDNLEKYKDVVRMTTEEFFKIYRIDEHFPKLDEYIEYQGHILRTLYRSYNRGVGVNMRNQPVADMCSVVEAIFGSNRDLAVYSVVHSRSLEGEPGMRLLGRIAKRSGCDPMAALDMEPDYIKAILEPLGMLKHPILFITDNQRPEILEKLLEDPDIGPNIHLVPETSSWIGGDITVALMADVFIGNPASTFSGFIAKSRVALGYDAGSTYLFRKKNKLGKWVDACDHRCIFDSEIMNAMA